LEGVAVNVYLPPNLRDEESRTEALTQFMLELRRTTEEAEQFKLLLLLVSKTTNWIYVLLHTRYVLIAYHCILRYVHVNKIRERL